MTHIRCGTVKWLGRRSIGQLIIIFASPSLPLIALMSVMGCGSRGEFGVGAACSLAEMGLMLCGATIGVLLAFEIYQERKRKDEGLDGRLNEPGMSGPAGGSKASGEDKKGSPSVGLSSKNDTIATTLEKRMRVAAQVTIGLIVVAAVWETGMLDAQSNQTSNLVPRDAQSNQTSNLVPRDAQFVAAATIMGFAVFGSALAIPRQRKQQVRSIAYALVAFVIVQAVFMATLVSDFSIPTILWVALTAAWLFGLVAVMVANRIPPDGASGDAELTR